MTPAPGAYDVNGVDLVDHTAPAYSFGLRPALGRTSDTPAPNAYAGAVPADKHIAYSFGVKPDEPAAFVVPGPGAYSPESVAESGVAHSFGIKHREEKIAVTPGMLM